MAGESTTMPRTNQAAVFQELRSKDPARWKELPAVLTGVKKAASPNADARKTNVSVPTVNHYPTGERKLPPEFIDPIAGHFFGWDGKVLSAPAKEFACKLREALEDDDAGEGDFWDKVDQFFRKLKIAKLTYLPFSGSKTDSVPPFIDFVLDRFQRFSAHGIEITERPDLGDLLNRITDKRRTVRAVVGVLSSSDRLTMLRTLLFPPRVGLNAVVLKDHEREIGRLRKMLLGREPFDPEVGPIALKHEVGYNHLCGLGVPKDQIRQVDELRPKAYAAKLAKLRGKGCPVAVADEVTCLSILGCVREQQESARLVFPLATRLSVRSQKPEHPGRTPELLGDKTELPEFMLSIAFNRGPADTPVFEYVRDAFWQLLQTDVELIANQYASLCFTLEEFAAARLPEDQTGREFVAREWAEYTLRLQDDFLDAYVDQCLPWKPILRRAIGIVAERRESAGRTAIGAAPVLARSPAMAGRA